MKKCYVTLPNVQISRNERRGHAGAARFGDTAKRCDGITKASENQARGPASFDEKKDETKQNDIKEFGKRNDAFFGASALDLLISRSSCNKLRYLSLVLCGVAR
jgi:hypothetical protein